MSKADSLRLVNFIDGQVDSVLCLPDRQVKVFENIF